LLLLLELLQVLLCEVAVEVGGSFDPCWDKVCINSEQ
jgi:hypothetical protein